VFDEIPHWHESLVLFLQVKLVAPSLMPKLGKAGSLQSRVNIVHSLAHTESWAIDLSWVLTFLTLCFAVAWLKYEWCVILNWFICTCFNIWFMAVFPQIYILISTNLVSVYRLVGSHN
jgi:hypothetical protein